MLLWPSLWLLMLTAVMAAMLTNWLTRPRVRAGMAGAGFGVIGAAPARSA